MSGFISAVLLCIYFDVLLTRVLVLEEGIGCYISNCFLVM